jgi:cytochrome c oxidase subunit II
VRRRLLVCLPVVGGALVVAGAALASNGGISPVSPNSPNAGRIDDAYWLILALTGAIFLIVEGALITFIVRYRGRGRPRSVEGPQVHGATKLELIWTALPVLILAAIAGFVFYKLPGIKSAPPASAADRMNVTVEAHQFYWRFIYPDGRESINVLRVPVDRVVVMDVKSADVIHSWWVPALGGKVDAIPGKTNHIWFRAERTGSFPIRCAEFCGLQHAAMRGFVQVVQGQAQPQAQIGKQAVNGVCATCHGFRLEGLVGPAIADNPTLNDPKALRTVITHGFQRMPAVGKTWDAKLLNATIGYLKSHYGAQSGGSTSGGTTSGG